MIQLQASSSGKLITYSDSDWGGFLILDDLLLTFVYFFMAIYSHDRQPTISLLRYEDEYRL